MNINFRIAYPTFVFDMKKPRPVETPQWVAIVTHDIGELGLEFWTPNYKPVCFRMTIKRTKTQQGHMLNCFLPHLIPHFKQNSEGTG